MLKLIFNLFQFILFFFCYCLFIAMTLPVGEELPKAELTSLHLTGDNYHESKFFHQDLDVAENRRRKPYKMSVLIGG